MRLVGPGPTFPPTWPKVVGLSRPACLASLGWSDLSVVKPKGKQTTLDTFSNCFPSLPLCFHFWWIHRGISAGSDSSLLVFHPHRKLDEEYKERIAALKHELRKEREQIMQQVGKQRLELEQEVEKAKTEENYIRDRLALSLKVIILLVLWSVSWWGYHMENHSSLIGKVCTEPSPRIPVSLPS